LLAASWGVGRERRGVRVRVRVGCRTKTVLADGTDTSFFILHIVEIVPLDRI
jgi:hypothetical protein